MSSSFRRDGNKPRPSWLLPLILVCCLCPLHDVAIAQSSVTGAEYRVKAGFIYHFARFTQWPESAFKTPDSPILLCIASTRPETDLLLDLHGNTVFQRKIVVRNIHSTEASPNCHILFIASDDRAFVLKQLQSTALTHTLTVSDMDGFTSAGGMIGFFPEDARLRFRVNLNATDRAGLKFSSQLLMSADIVRKDP